MGTRSRIGVMHGDNVKSVYCHWDGYLEHNGYILQTKYDSVKANKLVSMGDLSSLGADIGEAHDFARDVVYVDIGGNVSCSEDCTFYGRDRGEEGTGHKTHTSFVDFIECVEGSWCEWYYIMKDGVWYCGNVYKEDSKFYKKLVPLTEAMWSLRETA
jgi:hypothetical protein